MSFELHSQLQCIADLRHIDILGKGGRAPYICHNKSSTQGTGRFYIDVHPATLHDMHVMFTKVEILQSQS